MLTTIRKFFESRKRIIMDRVCNEPYLERYYIFLTAKNVVQKERK
jgi:hypothetical protein